MSVVEGFEFFGGGFPAYDLSLGSKPAGLKTVKRKYHDWWFHNSRGHPLVYCQARSAPPKNEVYGCLYKEYEEFGIKLWFCGASRSNTGASYTDHDVYTAAHKVSRRIFNRYERQLM